MTYKLQMVFIDNVANALKFVSTTCHLKIKKKALHPKLYYCHLLATFCTGNITVIHPKTGTVPLRSQQWF